MKINLFLACCIACALCSCETESVKLPRSYLSFEMNSTEYTFDASQFGARSPAAGYCSIRNIGIFGIPTGSGADFPYWIDIRKTRSGEICAILMPKVFPVPFIEDYGICDFQIPIVDFNGDSLSMQEVFFYENGTMTYSKSDCENRDYFDFGCLCTYDVYMCDLEGSFHLTFRNGLGESITLADAHFLQMGARQ